MAYNGGSFNNFGGGGYGASNFAPQGGYVASTPNNDESPATDSTPNKKRSGATNQSLVPLTIKQLHNATQAHPDDIFRVDGRELNQVTIVANILQISNLTTNVNFVVDDGTGKIDVRVWLDADDKNDHMAQQKSEWREGAYVRIVGHLRSFHNKRSIVGFKIIPITDFNELTYHFLEAIYVHLYNARGGIAQPQVTHNNVNNYNTPYQRQPANNVMTPSGGDINQSIMQVITMARSGEGVSVQFISGQLNRSEDEVRQAIEFLAAEGHLYSTIDEDHYQTTDANNM